MKFLRTLLRLLVALIIIAAVVYGYFAMTFTPTPTHPYHQGLERTLVIAHRGGKGERPENTMLAFEYARGIGADALELDVHMTSDGVLVVIHDETVNRTTDGIGLVHELSYADLSALDAGYRYEESVSNGGETSHPYRGSGLRIPMLDEVLSEFASLRLLIEIKPKSSEVANALCDAIRAHGMTERVLVSSFLEQPLYDFRSACPKVATGATESEALLFFALNRLGLDRAARPAFASFALPLTYNIAPIGEVNVISERFLRGASLHNIPIDVWTINDETEMRRLLAQGVSGIITDYPSRLLEISESFVAESTQ